MNAKLLSILLLGMAICKATAVTYNVENVAALEAQPGASGAVAIMKGYWTAGDGGGGTFDWASGSSPAANTGTIFAASGGGRWVRQGAKIDVRMFGAKGDGVTNDRLKIQAAIDYSAASGNAEVYFGGKTYYVSGSSEALLPAWDTSIYLPQYVRGILTIGFHPGTNKPDIKLFGEGASISTDDERGGTTLGSGAHGGSPSVFMVQTKFSSLTIKDLTIDRKITGGRISVPGDYETLAETNARGSGPASGTTKSYWDHPHIYNREGIYVFTYDSDSVESIKFSNMTFVDCHRAFSFDDVANSDYPTYAGKVELLEVEGCRFLYPYGANIFVDANFSAGSGGQTTLMTSWINEARFLHNYFDGVTSGDVSGTYSKLPIDGHIFGIARKLVCVGNHLRHFDVEGIQHFASRNLVHIGKTGTPQVMVMTAVDVTTTIHLYSNALPAWVQDGQEVYVGADGGAGQVAGFMEITAISGDRRDITLKNLPVATNAAPTTHITLDDLWVQVPQYAGEMETIISNNIIDSSPVYPPDADPHLNGFGNPAIRVNDSKATITGNTLLNTVRGIELYSFNNSRGRMNGSVVADNWIGMADVRAYPFLSGSGPFGIALPSAEIIARNNTIFTPYANGFAGIIAGTNNEIIGNTIKALERGGETSWGILLYATSSGALFEGNKTSNLSIGIGPPIGQPASYTVNSHESTGDGDSVSMTDGAIYRKQIVQFRPTEGGWYQILYSWPAAMGSLGIQYSDPPLHRFQNAEVNVDYSSGASMSNLAISQSSWNGSAPIIDKIFLAGHTNCELYVHVILAGQPATQPIQLTWKTETSGSKLFDRPTEKLRPLFYASVDTADAGAANTMKITTNSAHGMLAGDGFYLFDFDSNSHLNGSCIVESVISINELRVVRTGSVAANQNFLGGYLIRNVNAGNAMWWPDGLEKMLTLPSSPMDLGGGTITDDGSDDQPAYAFDGDNDTGMYHPAGDTLGFATNATPRLIISNDGVTIGDGGYPIQKVLSTRVTIDLSSIAANDAIQYGSIPLDGARVGDTVLIGLPANAESKVVYTAVVTTAGYITLNAANVSGSAIDPASGSYRFTVLLMKEP